MKSRKCIYNTPIGFILLEKTETEYQTR